MVFPNIIADTMAGITDRTIEISVECLCIIIQDEQIIHHSDITIGCRTGYGKRVRIPTAPVSSHIQQHFIFPHAAIAQIQGYAPGKIQVADNLRQPDLFCSIQQQRAPLQHLHIAGDSVIPHQLQRGTGMETQIIIAMTQLRILHQHGGDRAFVDGNAIALVNSTIFHTQTTAIEVRHGIHLRGAGIKNFLSRSSASGTSSLQQFIQMLFCVFTGKDDIALLFMNLTLSVGIISIQVHNGLLFDICRISELDTTPCCSGERYLFAAVPIKTEAAQHIPPF